MRRLLAGIGLLLVVSAPLWADDDLDVTMRMVVDDDELTRSVVREIPLPVPETPAQGLGRGGSAAEAASEARERGRALGQDMRERPRRPTTWESPDRNSLSRPAMPATGCRNRPGPAIDHGVSIRRGTGPDDRSNLAALAVGGALAGTVAGRCRCRLPARPPGQTLFEQGVQLFRQGHLEAARDCLEAARTMGLNSLSLSYNLGVVYYRLGRLPAAEQAFRQLLSSPHEALARYNLGLVALARDDHEQARSEFLAVMAGQAAGGAGPIGPGASVGAGGDASCAGPGLPFPWRRLRLQYCRPARYCGLPPGGGNDRSGVCRQR